MKKSVILILALLLLGTPLLAQDDTAAKPKVVKPTFTYGGMMYIFNAHENYQTAASGSGQAKNWIASRFRQYFGVKMGHVETMIKFEIDPVWGGDDTPSGDFFGMGADKKGELQIKNAYLKFDIPTLPMSVKAGILHYASPGKFVFTDDIAGGVISIKAAKNISLNLMYAKFHEDDKADNTDDADYYGVDATIKLDGMSISPAIYLGRYGKNSLAIGPLQNEDYYTITPMVNFTLNKGPISLDATVALGMGSIDGAPDKDLSGMGAILNGTFKFDKKTSVSLLACYMSGDDAGTTDKYESFTSFMPGLNYGGATKSFILRQAALFLQGGFMPLVTGNMGFNKNFGKTGGGDEYGYADRYGLVLVGGNFKASLGNLKIEFTGTLLNSAEEVTETGSKYFGLEFDLILTYQLWKNLNLVFQACVFLPGDEYKTTNSLEDTVRLFVIGTTFKW